MIDFSEKLDKLIEQAYTAGYTYACWCDGANVSNEEYHKSEADLRSAVKQFLDEYIRPEPKITFISEGGWGSLSKEEIDDIIKLDKDPEK